MPILIHHIERLPVAAGLRHGLGRNVNHHPLNYLLEHDTGGRTPTTVSWTRSIPIEDQGQLGKCTAMAAKGCGHTGPLFTSQFPQRWQAEYGAIIGPDTDAFYSAEEIRDGDGPYPPQDNGSSGPTSAEVLEASAIISAHTHTFSATAALIALQSGPGSIGIPWYNSMMDCPANGILVVDPSSGLAGGHEVPLRAFDSVTGLLTFDNSWGEEWGMDGSFNLAFSDFIKLLAAQGDATFFAAPGSAIKLHPRALHLRKFLGVAA